MEITEIQITEIEITGTEIKVRYEESLKSLNMDNLGKRRVRLCTKWL